MKPILDLARRDKAYGVIALVLALLLPAIVWVGAWRASVAAADAEARVRFELHAVQIRDTLAVHLLGYEQMLRGAAGLFAATQTVGRDEWRNYYESLQISEFFPGTQAIGYGPRIAGSELKTFVTGMRATGLSGYAISPPGARDEYVPVAYVEPLSQDNLRRFGRDMIADPASRTAMEEAVAQGRTALSGKMNLQQEPGQSEQPGFLMYVPVYARGIDTTDAAQRKRALQGYVYGLFSAQELFHAQLAGEEYASITIYGSSRADEQMLLFRSQAGPTSNRAPLYSVKTLLQIRDQKWAFHPESTSAFEATVDQDRPRLVLLCGVALHLLLLGTLWGIWATRTRAVRLARSMTREVRRREAEWQAMNDASPLGVFRADARGDFIYVNRRYALLSGLPAGLATGRGWLQAVHPEERDRVETEWNRLVGGGDPGLVSTYRIRRPDGELIWVASHVAAIVGEEGGGGYVGTVEDVTDRKGATDALLESRERLGMALDGSNLALFDWDISSGEVRLSEQWQLMMGGAKVDTVTTIDALQQLVHRDDLALLQHSLAQVLRGDAQFYEVEHRVRNLQGKWCWILSRAKVTGRDAAGRALRMVGTNADITEGKEVERLKSEFIATVSHELRTPLTAIIGSLSLIRETAGNLDPEVAGFLDMATHNSERLAALINDVLDIEKIGAGQMTIDLRPLQLREVLDKAVRINQPYAEMHNVRLRLLPGADFRVPAHPDRLMQVLTNLISNAAKFSPPQAEVVVSAAARGDLVRVEVRDHGPGIPENFRDQIFQRFERADNSNNWRKGGTGLGLAISKALVEHMNGSIGFDSVEGRGSTFYFELPLARGGASERP